MLSSSGGGRNFSMRALSICPRSPVQDESSGSSESTRDIRERQHAKLIPQCVRNQIVTTKRSKKAVSTTCTPTRTVGDFETVLVFFSPSIDGFTC